MIWTKFFFLTHQVNTSVVITSQNKIATSLINIITNALREPGYLHIISRNGG